MKEKNKKIKKDKGNNKSYYFLMIIIVSAFILIMWSRYISTTGLVIRESAVINETLPENFNGFKIVHFSDLHYKTTIFEDEVKTLVNSINELNPDIVTFTGDLVDKFQDLDENDIDVLSRELNRIDANIGKFAIKGNHDYASLYFDAIMEQTDFTVMNNSSELIYYNGNTPIYLVGLDDSLEGNIDYSIINNEQNYYSILMVHEPDVFDDIKDKGFDLMLSGHSHNGQVRIPLIGALVKVNGAKKYYDSHYIINNCEMFISGGLGTSKYKFRFLNKPSYNFYRLYTN